MTRIKGDAENVHSLLSAAVDVRGLAIKFQDEGLFTTSTAVDRVANLLVSDALLWAGYLLETIEEVEND